MIVKNVDFSVINQTVKFSTMAQIVANSVGIATATFAFSADWDSYDVIKVIFQNGETKKAIILTDSLRVVDFPAECMIAGRIAVSAVGLSGVSGEETFKRATVEKNNGVEVIASGAYEGSPADLPTPSEAEQILLIANAADAKATAAKAHADTYKGLRLAKRVIVPDGTPPPIIEIDKYEDGTPLNSVLGGELLFYSGENSSITNYTHCYLIINNINANNAYSAGGSLSSSMLTGQVGALMSHKVISVKNISGNFLINTDYAYRYSTGGTSSIACGGMTTPQTAVTAIKLFLSTGTFPAGTVVEWHERG